MTVRLPPRIERIVNDAVRSGRYRSAEDVLSEAIAIWRARQTTPAQSDSADSAAQAGTLIDEVRRTDEEERQAAIERLKGFGKAHKLSLGGMTIKQLRDKARPGVGLS